MSKDAIMKALSAPEWAISEPANTAKDTITRAMYGDVLPDGLRVMLRDSPSNKLCNPHEIGKPGVIIGTWARFPNMYKIQVEGDIIIAVFDFEII